MGREWKPGDVALVTFKAPYDGGKFGKADDPVEPGTFVAIARPARYGEDGVIWESAGGGGAHDNRRDVIADARPLLVLDPDDAEQMARLAAAWEDAENCPLDNAQPMTTRQLRMRAALRSLLDPKPAEPKALGAIVQDTDGDLWIRDCPSDCPDGSGCIPWAHVASGGRSKWDELSAVTIEHEGWQR